MRPIMHSIWANAGTTSTTGAQHIDSWTVGPGQNFELPTTIERIIGEISFATDNGDVGISWAIISNPSNEYEAGDIDPGSDLNDNRLAQAVLQQGCTILRSGTDAAGMHYHFRIDYKGNRKMLPNDYLTLVINLDNAISSAYKFTLKILHKPA